MKLKLLLFLLIFPLYNLVIADNKADTSYIESILSKSTELQRVNPDSCFLLAEEAYDLSVKAKFKTGIRGACIRLGSVWMTRGQNQLALPYLKRSLEIDLETKNDHGAAGDYVLLSYAYSALGHQDSGFIALYEALKISEASSDTALQIMVYTTLGDFNDEYQRYLPAKAHYLQAAKLASLNKDSSRLVAIYMGLGNVHYRLNEYEKALEYYLHVDTLSLQIGDELGYLQNLNNLALSYEELNQYSQAKDLYQRALIEYQKNTMLSESANIYFNLGSLFIDLKNIDSSIYYLSAAVNQFREISDLPNVARGLERLSEAYSLDGKFEKAYQYHKQYVNLSDSLINAEKIARISEMKTRYETEKKEQQIQILSEQNKAQKTQRNIFIIGSMGLLIFLFLLYLQRNRIKRERNKSDKLLLNILPKEVAEELKQFGSAKAQLYPRVTVLFTDFVNFTNISEQLSPSELVAEIDKNFIAFDTIIEKHGLEKIKTIGDAYMAVCGLPNSDEDHAFKVIAAAQEIISYSEKSALFKIRIGVSSGAVVAGIVGQKKYAYDIWGDTVNMAARMEQNSETGKINLSDTTYQIIRETIACTYRGKIDAKNKGEIDMYFIN